MQPSTALRVEIVRALGELESHRDAWNALAARAPQQLPMLSHAWIATYLEKTLPSESRWACFFAYQGATLAAVLTVVTQPASRFGVNAFALRTPRDDHTQIGDLLFASADDADAVPAMLSAVAREFPDAPYLEIKRFSADSALLDALTRNAFRGPRTWQVDSFGAYLPIPADFGSYRDSLSKNFRSNLNKATNKVARLPDVRFRFTDGRSSAPEDFAEFLKVEASGWKGEAGSAIAKSAQLVDFYATLARRLSEAGWLEWQFMTGDGCTLAANLAIRMPRSLVIWKLGYNDAYSRCSPGSILLEELVKREIAARSLEEINLTTNLPWYDNWEMLRRTYYTARFYFGWRGWFIWYLPDAGKELLRRMPVLAAIRGRLRQRQPAPVPSAAKGQGADAARAQDVPQKN
jgi:CelD/BcsL family acetyltransferase involved in cellulose biosynthesis